MRLLESTSEHFVGVDLGQRQDFTALCVVERLERRYDAVDRVTWQNFRETTYCLRYLQRVPLGTTYPAVVARVMKLVKNPKMTGGCELVVDATGVGGAVLDMLREAWPDGRLVPVTITGGKSPVQSGAAWSVPKRDLVVGLQVMFEKGEMRIAGNVPEYGKFLKELGGMRVKVSASGHDSYGNRRQGEHDDLVLAVAMACWRAKQPNRWNWFGGRPDGYAV